MAIIPFPRPEPPRRLPHAIESEQAVLGSALLNNALIERALWLQPEDFFEPVHGRIWAAMLAAQRERRLADNRTLAELFHTDPSLTELDGAVYLRRLADVAVTTVDGLEYARHVKDVSRRRALAMLASDLQEKLADPQGDDDPTMLAAFLREQLDALARDDSRPLGQHISAVCDEIEQQIINPPLQWSTGIPALDKSFGAGVPEGYVIGIEARPKNFKTGVAHTLLMALAAQNIPCCYFALEMGNVRLTQRMLGHIGNFNSSMFRYRDNEALRKVKLARQSVDHLSIHFVHKPGITFGQLRSTSAQMRERYGILLNVLDYWQLVRPDGFTPSYASFLADVAQWCADDAHEHGTTWIINSQENRGGESYGSDGLAKACDWLASLHKNETKLLFGNLGYVETLWANVKYSRDGCDGDIGSPEAPVLFIHPEGPHLAQLPGT